MKYTLTFYRLKVLLVLLLSTFGTITLQAQYGIEDLKDRINEHFEVIQSEVLSKVNYSNYHLVSSITTIQELELYLNSDIDLDEVETETISFANFVNHFDNYNEDGITFDLFIDSTNDNDNVTALPDCFQTWYYAQNVLMASNLTCCLVSVGTGCAACTAGYVVASAANLANYHHCISQLNP